MALRATASLLAAVLFLTLGTPYASRVHAQDPQGYQEAYVPADVAGSAASPYADDVASALGDTASSASVADLSALEASDPERAAALREALAAQASNPTVTPVSLPSGEAKSAVTPQAISLPKAEGSIEGMGESFSPSLSSGTGTFSVPIALPPGRAGVQPSLGLSYSSSSGNGDVGIGWSIGMPFISRQTDRGLPRYDDRAAWHPEEDRFFYNGGQELVPVSNEQAAALDGGTIPEELVGWQQYRARVEGAFMRFFREPRQRGAQSSTRWVVQSKDGTRFDFGILPTGTYPSDYGDLRNTLQTENADGTGRVFRWQLTRMSDTHGSTIYYRYRRNDGQLYTYDLHYVSPASCAGATPRDARECTAPLSSFARRVKFVYESRADANRSYVTGFRVRTAWRLRLVQVTGWNHLAGERTLVRRYWLTYDPSSFHSLLSSIQVEGRPESENVYHAMVGVATVSESTLGDGNPVGGALLPAMQFTYSQQRATIGDVPGFGGLNDEVQTATSSPNHSVDEAMTDLFDVNSDGLPDVIVTDPATYRTSTGRPAVGVFFNGFSGRGATPATHAGTFSDAVPMAIPESFSGVMRLSNSNVMPMDIDGDGRSDLLHMPRLRNYGYFTPVRGFADADTVAAVSPAQQHWQWNYVPVALPSGDLDPRIDFTRDATHIRALDVNNDHLVDVVRTTGTVIQTWLNLGWIPGGDGRFGSAHHDGTRWVMSTAPTESCLLFEGTLLDFEDSEVRLADMNGDGLQDIAKIRRGRVYYWPGRGLGIWGEGSFECARGEGAGRAVEMANPPPIDFDADGTYLEDVDGDGTSDVVQVRFREVSVWFNRAGESFTPTSVRLTGTPYAPGFAPRIRFTDIDGTGTGDIVWASAGNWQWIDFMGGVRPRVLVGVANGLGATTTMTYGSSAVEYLRDLRHAQTCDAAEDADDGCFRWSGARLGCHEAGAVAGNCDDEDAKSGGYRSGGSPVVSAVVKTVATSDHFDRVGREETISESEFSYHEAYYEGIEQEFRGFGTAEATVYGDDYHPTSVAVTRFHQGRRPNEVASDRTRDNPDEALKGREWLTEQHDGNANRTARNYLSSTHAAYTVRKLLTGLNGVAVSYAYVRSTEDVKYDLRRPGYANTPYAVGGIVRETATSSGSEMPRTGTAPDTEFVTYGHTIRLRHPHYAIVGSSIDVVDHVGDLRQQRALGRVIGEYGEPIGPEEIITSYSVPVNLGGESGWLWRAYSSTISGYDPLTGGTFSPPSPVTTYNTTTGDVLLQSQLVEMPWDFEFGPGTDGSLAYHSGDQTVVASTTYDAWGNSTASCGGGDIASGAQVCLRYATVTYEDTYRQFPSSEAIATGFGGQSLATAATFDEGLGALLTATDPNSVSTSVTYDGLGRLTSMTPPALGYAETCTRPATVLQYMLTTSPTTEPVSRVHSTTYLTCGGPTTTTLEAWSYVDGLGRPRASLATSDTAGMWIRSGISLLSKRGEPYRAYHNDLAAGTAASAALALPATSIAKTEARYDAFGRQYLSIAEDGSTTVTSYHALSTDVCDPLDNDISSFAANTCTTVRTDGHGRTIDQTLRNRQSRVSAIEVYRLWSYYRPDGALVALVRAQTDETLLRKVAPSDMTGQAARVARYFAYDSAGRRLGATDPDSDSRSAARTMANRTWRYHFNRIGDLIAVRDPRGCGQNFFYDRGGRLVGEDYVLCDEAQRPSEVSTSYVQDAIGSERLTMAEPVDVKYEFDAYPEWATSLMGTLADGEPAAPGGYASWSKGQATAVSDRGQRSAVAYDQRGNAVWSARQMAVIGDAGPVASTTTAEIPEVGGADFGAQSPVVYDARRYVREAVFDFANRPKSMTLPLNPDAPLAPRIGGALSYSTRGLPVTASVTFGGTAYTRVIVAGTQYNEDGLVTRVDYGDAMGPHSATFSTTAYDVRNRPTRMTTTRDAAHVPGAPGTLSGVTLVADQSLTWDAASNLTRIEDDRIAAEWPAASRPQTIDVAHDALYRVTNAQFNYTLVGGGYGDDDAVDWRTSMDATHAADPMRTQPAPPVAPMPPDRVRDLTWSYDWLGNMTEWTDDAHQFYERSIGDIRNGYGYGDHRPSALYFSADLGGTSTTNRGGYVELAYGEGGNALSMTVHGECGDRLATTCAAPETPYGDPSGGSSSSARAAAAHATCQCKTEQHYQYRWDELNRIAEARRYDRDGTESIPEWKIAVRQRYRYDSANVRIVKQTLETLADTDSDGFGDGDGDPQERLTLYVYPGDFERRGLTRDTSGTSYIAAVAKVGVTTPSIAETQYIVGGARVVWEATAEPTRLDGSVTKTARVTLGIGDLIGTTGALLDLESGELVEASTYYPNGARETYVRNGGGVDDAIAPETLGFTGKEGDEEVGLTYFGERYLISRIGRWASPDPLQIHAAGGGEVGNSYHYVGGNLLKGRDPLGLGEWDASSDMADRAPGETITGYDGTEAQLVCGGADMCFSRSGAQVPTAAPVAPSATATPRSNTDAARALRAAGRSEEAIAVEDRHQAYLSPTLHPASGVIATQGLRATRTGMVVAPILTAVGWLCGAAPWACAGLGAWGSIDEEDAVTTAVFVAVPVAGEAVSPLLNSPATRRLVQAAATTEGTAIAAGPLQATARGAAAEVAPSAADGAALAVCFVLGTLVDTPKGPREIQDIETGEEVYAFDEDTGERVVSTVIQTFQNRTDTLIDLTVRYTNGDQLAILSATPEHPFYIPSLGHYVAIGELRSNTMLATSVGGTAFVVSSTVRRGDFEVFNFEVDGIHNYFVSSPGSSQAGVLVHNDCFDTVRAANNLARSVGLTTNEAEVFRRLSQYHGIEPRLASTRLHALKAAAGRGGADNVIFDFSGNVFSPETGELLGSLTQGGAGVAP